MALRPTLGVLGGTGVYSIDGLERPERLELDTPFGRPSGPIVVGRWMDVATAFLARHGEGHRLSPTQVNYRANIYALKSLGVERLVAVSACGSLRGEIHPGEMVVPDQIFDATRARPRSFFEEEAVVHVSAPDPFCPVLSRVLADAAEGAGARVHRGGAYLTVEGPRFSTRAESQTFRSWGMAIIGMTTSPEAFLAREAELCYAVLAHVTDYDVWHTSEAPVTAEMVLERLKANARLVEHGLRRLVPALPETRDCDCGEALHGAFVTPPSSFPVEARRRLGILIQRYLD